MSVGSPGLQLINLEQELKKSYLDYAMSVIVGRALPDCRDGLKPVHRRILYAMHELGNTSNKPYKKSARIVGDVMGKYHPHGDSAIYDAIVRMAQDFSMRYQLIDGQGNFGSIDGDSAAAMRYTEIRMRPLTTMLLDDLDKDTVTFSPNYDGNEVIPDVLPSRVPNFLVNGTSGIAVGMASQVPPHNITEVMNAFLYYLDHPDASCDDLMKFIPAPDFPTGAQMLGARGARQGYLTGRGRVVLRSVTHMEENNNRRSIVVTEIPYQVNKARLIEKIAELARDKKLEGISALRDESDKDGIRIVIDLKRDTNDQILLNNLFQQTQMQTVFSMNMIGLVHGQPKTLTLLDVFKNFYLHRFEVINRRTKFELGKARAKSHSLEGLAVALDNLDEVIELIKASANTAEAKQKLTQVPFKSRGLDQFTSSDLEDLLVLMEYMPYGKTPEGYHLSIKQAETILEMKLHKLTSMEQEQIKKDYATCLDEIRYLKEILENDSRKIEIMKEESLEIIKRFGDARKTKIVESQDGFFEDEDLIPPEDLVVTLSKVGYIKTISPDSFEAQRRGGKGKMATRLRDEDSIHSLLVAHSHDHLLCFSTKGKVYKLRVFELPSGSRAAAGKPVVNFLPLSEGETISAMLCVKNFEPGSYIFMSTAKGVVKKVGLEAFSSTRSQGIIALDLDDADFLQHAFLTDGTHNIMLFSNQGKAIRFHETDVRPMGRQSRGVRGMRLDEAASIISAFSFGKEQEHQLVLSASVHGYGKCTPLDQFTQHHRGGQGMLAMNCSARNGEMVGALLVGQTDQIMFLTVQGMMLRTNIQTISISSRNTQGVRLVTLNQDDALNQIQAISEGAEIIEEDDQGSD